MEPIINTPRVDKAVRDIVKARSGESSLHKSTSINNIKPISRQSLVVNTTTNEGGAKAHNINIVELINKLG